MLIAERRSQDFAYYAVAISGQIFKNNARRGNFNTLPSSRQAQYSGRRRHCALENVHDHPSLTHMFKKH